LMESGVLMSGPAIVLSARARSALERPRHPLVASVDQPKWLDGLAHGRWRAEADDIAPGGRIAEGPAGVGAAG